MFGSGRIAFEAICHSATMIDSSPRRLEMTSPLTKTWSPRSTSSFHSCSDSSPTPASDTIAWMRLPSPDCRVAKQSLPVLRLKTMRPATAAVSPVSAPASSVAEPLAQRRNGVGDRHGDRIGAARGIRPLRDQALPLGEANGLLLEDVLFGGLGGGRCGRRDRIGHVSGLLGSRRQVYRRAPGRPQGVLRHEPADSVRSSVDQCHSSKAIGPAPADPASDSASSIVECTSADRYEPGCGTPAVRSSPAACATIDREKVVAVAIPSA